MTTHFRSRKSLLPKRCPADSDAQDPSPESPALGAETQPAGRHRKRQPVRPGLSLASAGVIFLSVLTATDCLGEATADRAWSSRILERFRQASTDGPGADTPVIRRYALEEGIDPARTLAWVQRLMPQGGGAELSADGREISVLAPPSLQGAIHDLISWQTLAITGSGRKDSETLAKLDLLEKRIAEAMLTAEQLEAFRQEIRPLASAAKAQPSSAKVAIAVGMGIAALGLLTLPLLLRRRTLQKQWGLYPTTDAITRALLPETQRQSDAIQSALVELGTRLQASLEPRNRELLGLRDEVERLRTGQIEHLSAGRVALEQATATMVGTAERLSRENDRIQALAGELRDTLGELDQTRDRLREAEGALNERDSALRSRDAALERERAKLAALSLILEHLPPGPSKPATAANGPMQDIRPAFKLYPIDGYNGTTPSDP